MIGLLLCGGEGKRLYPITLEYRKIDLLVNSETILNRQKRFLFNNDNIDTIFEIIGNNGTAGDIKPLIESNPSLTIVLYGDTLYDFDLNNMITFHNTKKAVCTINVIKTDVPCEKGIVLLGRNNQIISFEEKPEHPKSDWSFGGIIICDRRILNCFPKKKKIDWAKDVFPRIKEGFYAYKVPKNSCIDIGTFKGYEKAIKYYRKKEGRKK